MEEINEGKLDPQILAEFGSPPPPLTSASGTPAPMSFAAAADAFTGQSGEEPEPPVDEVCSFLLPQF